MVSPVGNTVESTWAALLAGTPGAAPIKKFDPARLSVRFACEVKGFDPLLYIDKKEARRYDLFAQFALAAAHQAMTQAGLEGAFPSADRTGVVIGSGIGGMQTYEENCSAYYPQGAGPGLPLLRADVHSRHRRGAGVHPVRAQGSQLRHGLGLRLVGPRHRRVVQADPLRGGRRNGDRRLRGGDHRAHRRGLLQHEGAVQPQRRPRHRQPAVRQGPRRLRAGRRRRRSSCWRAWSTPSGAGRRSWARSSATG